MRDSNPEDRPKVGVSIVLVKDDQVLMGKRKGSHGAGTYSFPGGHIEFGEEFEQAVLKELREETSLSAENLTKVTWTNDIFVEEEKHYITLFYRGDYCGG